MDPGRAIRSWPLSLTRTFSFIVTIHEIPESTEVNGLRELLSEDFQHGRFYGTVRAVDPFQ